MGVHIPQPLPRRYRHQSLQCDEGCDICDVRAPAPTSRIAWTPLKEGQARQSGSVASFFVLFLIPLLSFGALAIDIAWVTVVKNELQNAADAAALTGAAKLTSSGSSTRNWTQAAAAANTAVGLNRAAGPPLSVVT
ncbi:pilus assembly protein TadG-related protein [Burkholderia ambifaria]|uniref:pilus assembly protein TadG-related protein n=1 Tax=Burkholderia ambifaria TaxID=152480 RepID=UPI001E5075EB|nr:Tad domain-containing protein [Burkholderia ambifaria]